MRLKSGILPYSGPTFGIPFAKKKFVVIIDILKIFEIELVG